MGSKFGPKFLVYLIENGRTMGFLVEYLTFRPPSKNDLTACIAVLRGLNDLGLIHYDINRKNLLMMEGYVILTN